MLDGLQRSLPIPARHRRFLRPSASRHRRIPTLAQTPIPTTPSYFDHLEVRDVVSTGRAVVGSLYVQHVVPVLGRGRPRRRHVHRRTRLARRQGQHQRAGCVWSLAGHPDLHPREHPEGQLAGARLRGRSRHARAEGGAAQRVDRKARWPGGRSGETGRPSRRRGASAHHVRGARRERKPEGRQRDHGGPDAVSRRDRQANCAARHRLHDDSGIPGLRREGVEVHSQGAGVRRRSARSQRGVGFDPLPGVNHTVLRRFRCGRALGRPGPKESSMLTTTDRDTLTRHRMLLSASIITLAGAAWLALWMMGASAHASMHHHHHHGTSIDVTPMFSLLFFVGSWTVMTIAMMLPTSLPILNTFQAIAGSRDDRTLLLTLAVAGYLVTWGLFGAVVHHGQLSIHQLVIASAWAQQHVWAGGGAILLLAGAYQFTPLKYRCLEKCRSPLSFVIEHWQGRNHRQQAFRLGFDHGLFCVGCCWALMLLMFVVGMTNLGWMLILALVMAVEKNTRWGRVLSAPLGMALLSWGGATLVWH